MTIAFTGSRREYDVVGIDAVPEPRKSCAPAVVLGYSVARLAESFALGQVGEGSRVGERLENFRLRIQNSAFCGIRNRQVQQLLARTAVRLKRLREPIRIQTPFCARGKHEDDKRPLELYHRCLRVGTKHCAFLSGQYRAAVPTGLPCADGRNQSFGKTFALALAAFGAGEASAIEERVVARFPISVTARSDLGAGRRSAE